MSENSDLGSCACARCPNRAEVTAYSPYMDDYCHECTMTRCDVGGHPTVGLQTRLKDAY